MKIEFIKQLASKEGIGDYRTGLIILKDGIEVINMKVDNENDIEKIVKLFRDMEKDICKEELI